MLSSPAMETVAQGTNAHTCHLERSERSCIFNYMRRKDFSPWLEVTIATQSHAGESLPGLDPGMKASSWLRGW
jgi:hypothetical protein